jgi:hypothetical protein
MADLKTILAELHYSPQWLDYDLLSGEFWLHQYSQYQTSSDKHTEHYRFEAFQAVLNSREMLDQATIDHYIELAVSDCDQSMGNSALARLIQWPGLTDGQLQYLNNHPACNKPFLRKLQQRVILLRELDSTGVSDETFERFLNSQDEQVHRSLLSIAGLKAEYLQRLSDRGVNKAIRNMARRRLQSFGKTAT